ncbi:hypothetical protein KKF91_17830 [Myxococcota bacterium]|nr:hypothetical protein [Myxococcota bacterium]MBU1432401.1 hypothetical protein [Myxococcota bacterium]MBU1899464.1 hypothetical protein [Myxococcota bacterium]
MRHQRNIDKGIAGISFKSFLLFIASLCGFVLTLYSQIYPEELKLILNQLEMSPSSLAKIAKVAINDKKLSSTHEKHEIDRGNNINVETSNKFKVVLTDEEISASSDAEGAYLGMIDAYNKKDMFKFVKSFSYDVNIDGLRLKNITPSDPTYGNLSFYEKNQIIRQFQERFLFNYDIQMKIDHIATISVNKSLDIVEFYVKLELTCDLWKHSPKSRNVRVLIKNQDDIWKITRMKYLKN